MITKEDFVKDVYTDKVDWIEKLLKAANAKVKMIEAVIYYDEPEDKVPNWEEQRISADEYAVAVDESDLGGPSIKKFLTKSENIDGLGPMVTETRCYYDDMVDVARFDFEVDTKSPDYDGYRVVQAQDKINEINFAIRNSIRELMNVRDAWISSNTTMWRNEIDEPLATNYYDYLPYDIYFNDAGIQPNWDGSEGIYSVIRTYEPIDGFEDYSTCSYGYMVTKIEYIDISLVSKTIYKRYGHRILTDKYVIDYDYKTHFGEYDGRRPYTDVPAWVCSATDEAQWASYFEVIDPETGEAVPVTDRIPDEICARRF